jgi:hypothetical protein
MPLALVAYGYLPQSGTVADARVEGVFSLVKGGSGVWVLTLQTALPLGTYLFMGGILSGLSGLIVCNDTSSSVKTIITKESTTGTNTDVDASFSIWRILPNVTVGP